MDEIGYWITDLKDEKYCAPQEVVGHLATDVREKIAIYLEVIGDCFAYHPPPHPDPETASDANAARLRELIAASRPLPMSADFWIDWCAARRSPRFLERLRQARIEAEQRDLDPFGAAACDEIAREVARSPEREFPCVLEPTAPRPRDRRGASARHAAA